MSVDAHIKPTFKRGRLNGRSGLIKLLKMDKFKIELFEVTYGKPFPAYRSLDRSECNDVVDQLAGIWNINKVDIEKELAAMQRPFSSISADSDGFSLIAILSEVGILSPGDKLLINWRRFEEIDEMDISDLHDHFDDIWFPGPDDIDIMDKDLKWVFTVRHDGAISYLKDRKI